MASVAKVGNRGAAASNNTKRKIPNKVTKTYSL